jgi:hypothetical protein
MAPADLVEGNTGEISRLRDASSKRRCRIIAPRQSPFATELHGTPLESRHQPITAPECHLLLTTGRRDLGPQSGSVVIAPTSVEVDCTAA